MTIFTNSCIIENQKEGTEHERRKRNTKNEQYENTNEKGKRTQKRTK